MSLLEEFDDQIISFRDLYVGVSLRPTRTFKYIHKSGFSNYTLRILLVQFICYFVAHLNYQFILNNFSTFFEYMSVLNFVGTLFSMVLVFFFLRLFLELLVKTDVKVNYFASFVYCTIPLMFYEFFVMLLALPLKFIGINFFMLTREIGFIQFIFHFWTWYLIYISFRDFIKDRSTLVLGIIVSVLFSYGICYFLLSQSKLSELFY